MNISNAQDPMPVKSIEDLSPDIIGFSIHNEPTKADYIFMNNLFSEYLQDRNDIKLLLRLNALSELEIDHLFEEFKTTFDYYKKRVKVALLLPPNPEEAINLGKLVTEDVEIKRFKGTEEPAVDWLLRS